MKAVKPRTMNAVISGTKTSFDPGCSEDERLRCLDVVMLFGRNSRMT